jgi:electron transfer flavoprotein alpha/beta subunit
MASASTSGIRNIGGVAVLLRRLQARPGTLDDVEVLGRCERGALALALDLGAGMGAPVTAIAIGPARREDRVLAMALRAGCERAVRISDEGLDELDYLGLAHVLAAAVRHVGAKVIACGDRSQDEGSGAVGPAVAELLEAAHLTGIARVTVDGTVLLAERAVGGVLQRFRCAPPVVLCTTPPPLASAAPVTKAAPDDDEEAPRDTRRAAALVRVATIEELDLGKLGLDARALAHRKGAAGRLRAVRGGHRATIVSGAAQLIERLRAEHLVDHDRRTAPADAAPDDAARAAAAAKARR